MPFPNLLNEGDKNEMLANGWVLRDEALADVPQSRLMDSR